MKYLLSFIAFIGFQTQLWSQDNLAIGGWREHVPFDRANSVAQTPSGLVYCGSEAGFIAYNPGTREIRRYTKVTGLSDVGVQLLEYGKEAQALLVAYKQGNIDLIQNNRITNIPDIIDDNRTGDKNIYNIRFDGQLAYLSCGFGIVVLNIERQEIKDTYNPTQSDVKVNDVYIRRDENRIYAATDSGIYYGDLNDNLLDYNQWKRITSIPKGEFNLVNYYADRMLFNHVTSKFDSNNVYGYQNGQTELLDSVFGTLGNVHFQVTEGQFLATKNYQVQRFDSTLVRKELIYVYDGNEEESANPSEAIIEGDRFWIADKKYGLVEFYYAGEYRYHTPNGPNTLSINNIDIDQGVIWTAAGLLDNGYGLAFNAPEFNIYKSKEWEGTDLTNEPKLQTKNGYITLKINPNDPSQAFSGTWGKGLTALRDGKVEQHFDTSNSGSHTLLGANNTSAIKIGGMDFDRLGNLWVSNSETPYALHKYNPADGSWLRYFLGQYIGDFTVVGQVLVTKNDHKWILLNKEGTIVVFDESRPNGDQARLISSAEGSGGIPGGNIHCMAEDAGGSIWIGTDEGPAVFYNAASVFDRIPEAQRVFVQQDGQTQVLLETENIKSIKVDGANRKWFGTTNSGAYLMSADGTKEIQHFTEDNSVLFSDDIKFIDIDDESGEVYFCTENGLLAYRGNATVGGDGFSEVQVYPNPVPQGYGGEIAIKGLAQNSNVKITNMNGVLVFETTAKGGQATWDGYSLTGNKASNGVYLIFATNESGDSQTVSKIMYLGN